MANGAFFTPLTRRQEHFLIPAFLVIGIFLLYHEAIWFKFVTYDDDRYVTNNRYVQEGITGEGIYYAFTTGEAANWLPLTWLSHMAVIEFLGDRPIPHHLVNVAIHAVNVVLLFFLLRRTTGALWPSLVVAALFAAHPLAVESVAWISERKGLLHGLFWLLGFHAYAHFVSTEKRRYYALVCLCFALALLSKPSSITFPCALLLLDYWPLNRYGETGLTLRRFKTLLIEKIPLFLLCIPSSAITYLTQNADDIHVDTWFPIAFVHRLENAVMAYVTYPVKLVWPSNLGVHDPHPHGSTPLWLLAVATLLLIGITAMAIALRRRLPYFTVGWFWYVGNLVPVIGIVQLGTRAMADRYMYMPMIGLMIIAVWGVRDFARKSEGIRRAAAPLATAAIAALCVVTFLQARHWQNSHALYRHALAVTDNNADMHFAMATLFASDLMFAPAIEHMETVVRLQPENMNVKQSAGSFALIGGEIDTAFAYFRPGFELDPSDPDVQHTLRHIIAVAKGPTRAAALELYIRGGGHAD